jgi:DNA-binding NtrC family response regulator
LAIDDDIAILTSIRNILQDSFEVSLAKNIEIAKTILGTTDVDLILLDMEMPGASGMEFLELIKNDPSLYHIPIIIVSSHGTAGTIVGVQKRGAIDFVVKPISPQILIEKVNLAFQGSRKKISRLGLARKLQILENSCVHGKSDQIERIIADLEQFSFDLQIDAEIAHICRCAKGMEYDIVDKKIRQLLSTI